MNGASQSLLSNTSLLNKTACPRELFPLSTVIVAGVDTALTSIVLVVLFIATQTVPDPTTVYVPLLVFVQIVLTVGVSFLISIVVVFSRDIRHALPLFLQVGLLVTPVAYGFDVVPVELRWVYSIVNPLGPIIDGLPPHDVPERGPPVAVPGSRDPELLRHPRLRILVVEAPGGRDR